MKINDAFPSNYLKASDFEEDTVVTITGVTMEEIGQGKQKENKAIVHFKEFDKGLVLNVTNKNAIEGMYGDETDDWTGKQITLFPTEVEFAGEQVMAIRVRLKKPANSGGATAAASKEQAIAAFKAAHEGESQAEKQSAWAELLKTVVPGKQPADYTAPDWQRVRLHAAKSEAISDLPEFEEADIPF